MNGENDPHPSTLIFDGHHEAAHANQLRRRQAEAAEAVRQAYRDRIAAAAWPTRLSLRLNRALEIRRAKIRLARELAPPGALYLRHF